MGTNKPFKIHQRQDNGKSWQVLALLVAALLLSLGIALIWQKFSDTGSSSSNPSLSSSSSIPTVSSSLPQSTSTVSEEISPSSQAESSEKSSVYTTFEGAVPESERVTSDYFDDAVFVGDSITSGISLYQLMENADVLADTSINLSSIYTKESIRQEDGTRIPIMDALQQKQYRKVYVMLGGNEVNGDSTETFLSRYGKIIDDIKSYQPNAIIYVQSMLPVTADNIYGLDNVRIDEFNAALLELCQEKEVYYLNVAECMKDESGMLPEDASPADGMHFGAEYYSKWFEYLKHHTVS